MNDFSFQKNTFYKKWKRRGFNDSDFIILGFKEKVGRSQEVFINILGIPLPAMVEAFFGKIPDMLEKAVNIVKGKKKGEGSGAKE